MKEFLRQVADHYALSCSDKVFVLPSQRAVVFLRKYLCEAAARANRAMILPPMLSVDEFYASLSRSRTADRITLLVLLYECYKEECGKYSLDCGSLDDFIFWGDIILADFQDVDKYEVDPCRLFRNIAQYRQIQDDFADLEGAQKEAMKRFLSNFCGTDGEFKLRFSRVWDMLYPLYVSFNERLDSEGLAYQGSLYRKLLEEVRSKGVGEVFKAAYPDSSKVVFCGLNALCECEKRLLDKFRDLALADFVWDWCSPWIRDDANKASFFMRDNVRRFPQAFELEDCVRQPQIEVVSVSSAVGQVQYLSDSLAATGTAPDVRTAVMLPDEHLLLPLLNCLPPNVDKVNVTMGCSMAETSFFSLLRDLGAMQLRVRYAGGSARFYHRNVWNVVNNNIFKALADTQTLEAVQKMKKDKRYYVDAASFASTELLRIFFSAALPADFPAAAATVSGSQDADAPVSQNAVAPGSQEASSVGVSSAAFVAPAALKNPSAEAVEALASYLSSIVDYIGRRISSDEQLCTLFPLEMDFAMECSRILNLLRDKQLCLLPQTFVRLFENLVRSASVPFKGEPLLGMQVMGPLELRALDFETLYILSSNEAVFPRKSVSSSFIPHFLRKDFGLPTYEYQDAVWAYYFYRSIQRCRKLVMIYDSRTDGLQSGEESRYIKQLRYHYGAEMTEKTAVPVQTKVSQSTNIAKTKEMVDRLHRRRLSASALKSYLKCRAQFYYYYVEGLKLEDEVAESLDAGMIGNVFHSTMDQLYSGKTWIGEDYIKALLKNKAGIEAMVERFVKEELKAEDIYGRNIIFAKLILGYVIRALECDLQFIKDSGRNGFDFVGVELPMEASVGNFKLYGKIDRLDSFVPGTLRVVDYKTGKVLPKDEDINDGNAIERADFIFDLKTKSSNRPEIALQFFIYDYLLRNGKVINPDGNFSESPLRGCSLMNSVYSTRSIRQKQPSNLPLVQSFYDEMEKHLMDLLNELENTSVPFDMTDDTEACKWCDFKNICGR